MTNNYQPEKESLTSCELLFNGVPEISLMTESHHFFSSGTRLCEYGPDCSRAQEVDMYSEFQLVVLKINASYTTIYIFFFFGNAFTLAFKRD